MSEMISRVANIHVAKAQSLKAIDFTIGLVRRLNAQKLLFTDTSFPELLRRLFELRSLAQKGVHLEYLATNVQRLNNAGREMLALAAKNEIAITPTVKDFTAFVQSFPNTVNEASLKQSVWLERLIASGLQVPQASVTPRLLSDRDFFEDAYDIAFAAISPLFGQIAGAKYPNGILEKRIKQAKSCWGKQFREGEVPFTQFRDLVGVRVTTHDLKALASAAAIVQSRFKVLDKKNYYLKGEGYNAINYNLQEGPLVFELQVKTNINAIEAQISHDLIYAPEKMVTKLSKEERDLVALVITVSTQISMAEWKEMINDPQIKLATR